MYQLEFIDKGEVEDESDSLESVNLEEEFFDSNLSVDEEIAKEIEEKERNIDDEMWSESRQHIEEVMSVLHFNKEEVEEQLIMKQDNNDRLAFSKQTFERNLMLDKYL